MNSMNETRIYFDMDSVLADFEKDGTGILHVSPEKTLKELEKLGLL